MILRTHELEDLTIEKCGIDKSERDLCALRRFNAKRKNRHFFCCIDCNKAKKLKVKDIDLKICPICKSKFFPIGEQQNECSEQCRRINNVRKAREGEIKYCQHCKKKLNADTDFLYCSTDCYIKSLLTKKK